MLDAFSTAKRLTSLRSVCTCKLSPQQSRNPWVKLCFCSESLLASLPTYSAADENCRLRRETSIFLHLPYDVETRRSRLGATKTVQRACRNDTPPPAVLLFNCFTLVRASSLNPTFSFPRHLPPLAVSKVDLLASICKRYTTVKRLVVRSESSAGDAAEVNPAADRNVEVEVEFTGPLPSEGPGALLCNFLRGSSVGAQPVELPRGRKKRRRTDEASSETSDSGRRMHGVYL